MGEADNTSAPSRDTVKYVLFELHTDEAATHVQDGLSARTARAADSALLVARAAPASVCMTCRCGKEMKVHSVAQSVTRTEYRVPWSHYSKKSKILGLSFGKGPEFARGVRGCGGALGHEGHHAQVANECEI